MLRFALVLLAALPLFAQLPAGVSRRPFPEGSSQEPTTLAVTGEGTLWAGMGVDPVVVRFETDGTTRRIDVPLWGLHAVTAGPDGAVWIGARHYIGRLDPATNRVTPWFDYKNVHRVLSGSDGNVWFVQFADQQTVWYPRLVRFSPGGAVLATYRVDNVRGIVFGSDGALWTSHDDGAADRLVRMTTDGQRTESSLEQAGELFAGPGFLWSALPDRIERLNLRGEVTGTFRVAMDPVAADALGNLWLRARTGEGEVVAQLTPGGVLTRFAPLPALPVDECTFARHGGFAILPDGRVAMTDYHAEYGVYPEHPCAGAGWLPMERVLTILDPAVAPVSSVEQLNPVPRRRIVRR